jgi:hypothetical protein
MTWLKGLNYHFTFQCSEPGSLVFKSKYLLSKNIKKKSKEILMRNGDIRNMVFQHPQTLIKIMGRMTIITKPKPHGYH